MANVVLDGVTYSGVDKVSLRDADNVGQRVEFVPAPTLITKNITANGTYNASSDSADGYSSVTVNVSAPPTPTENDVTFYDYDGTVVASYTAADFANLAAMPANPSHTGLVAEGWNWTLADAKTYVASYGKLNIGQMYHTASGKTEYDIEVNEATGMTATLSGTSGTEKDWGDGTVDTSQTHTYAQAGRYTIKLSGNTVPKTNNSLKIRSIRFSNSITALGSQFNQTQNCPRLEYITIPNSVTQIADEFFRQCTSLKAVILPNSVNQVPYRLCYRCYDLKTFIVPKDLSTFSTGTFFECYTLKNVCFGNATNIQQDCLYNAGVMSEVVFPSSVTNIGNNALTSVTLRIIKIYAITPPTLSSANSISSTVTTIYIPNGTLSAYQTASNWSNLSSKFVEMPA